MSMSGENTFRISSSPKAIDHLKKYTKETKELDSLGGSYWKPKGVELEQFHPSDIAVRIRTFPNGESKAEKIVTSHSGNSYTHENTKLMKGSLQDCIDKLEELGYEQWVGFVQSAIEYIVYFKGETFSVLNEKFNDESKTLKFECNNTAPVMEFLSQIEITEKDIITKNSAELLMEDTAS